MHESSSIKFMAIYTDFKTWIRFVDFEMDLKLNFFFFFLVSLNLYCFDNKGKKIVVSKYCTVF